MTEAVVNPLEVIDVGQQERDGDALAPGSAQLALQRIT
jgi:hypothetical protein